MNTRTFLDTAALLALALFAGCSDAGPPPSSAPVTADGRGLPVRPDGELLAANASTTKDILPTGKGLDVQDDPSPLPRTRFKVEYHGAPVLAGSQNLYVIFYGNWPNDVGTAAIYADFFSTLGSSPYFQIAARYPNAAGRAPSGGLLYGGSAFDAFSHGPTLSDADIIADIVSHEPHVAPVRFGHGTHRRVAEPHAGLATLATLM